MKVPTILRLNRKVSPGTMQIVALVEIAIAIILWSLSPLKVIPRPLEVFHALGILWSRDGLGQELLTSLTLNIQALAYATVISLCLAYFTVIPVLRPIVSAISKGRFLSMIGFTFVFTLIFGGGHALKLALLVFAVTVFYVTSTAAIVEAIPRENFDYARTLRLSETRIVWEVVILGTIDKMLDALRQNAAMGWMMLTLVEGIVRSEGGIGSMLLNENKHFLLPQVFAIQIVILTFGLLQDWVLVTLRRILCPYVSMTLERG